MKSSFDTYCVGAKTAPVAFAAMKDDYRSLAESVAKAAHVATTQGDVAMRELVAQIDRRIAVLETKAGRNAYRAIKARLEGRGNR